METIVLLLELLLIAVLLASLKLLDLAKYWKRSYKSLMQKSISEQHDLKAQIQALRTSNKSA